MSNKRQMDKFFKNIEKSIKSKAQESIMNKSLEVDCPKCKTKRNISFKKGKGKCPFCKTPITLNPNWV